VWRSADTETKYECVRLKQPSKIEVRCDEERLRNEDSTCKTIIAKQDGEAEGERGVLSTPKVYSTLTLDLELTSQATIRESRYGRAVPGAWIILLRSGSLWSRLLLRFVSFASFLDDPSLS